MRIGRYFLPLSATKARLSFRDNNVLELRAKKIKIGLNSKLPLGQKRKVARMVGERRVEVALAHHTLEVSSLHVSLEWDKVRQRYKLIDKDAKFRTKVNGILITRKDFIVLEHGDSVELGRSLKFTIHYSQAHQDHRLDFG